MYISRSQTIYSKIGLYLHQKYAGTELGKKQENEKRGPQSKPKRNKGGSW